MAGLIDYSIIKPELANALAIGFQKAQDRQQAMAQQERANKLDDLQLRAAQRGEEEALAEREAAKGATSFQDLAQRYQQAGLTKQSLAVQKQAQEQRLAQMKQAEDELKIGRSIAERAFSAGQAARAAAPGSEKQAILSILQQYQGRGIDLSQDMAEIAALPDNLALEHVFNRSQELKNLSEMVTTDTGEAIIRAPKFQAPSMASQSQLPVGAFQGPQQQVMNQLAAIADPAERAAATQAYQRQLMTQAPAGEVTRIQKSLTPAQKLQEQRAQRQLELQEQAANPEFQQRMAAAKTTGAEQAKASVAQQEIIKQINRTIPELENATKKGGLIDQSTGSGIGRMADVAAGFFGKATPGAIALGKLQPIATMVLMMQPRFEGPQSDKDTQLYKESAGQLADPNLPTEVRRQAGLQVMRIMKERKNQFVTGNMATIGAPVQPSAPSGAGPSVSNW